jgi:hypothetical protein
MTLQRDDLKVVRQRKYLAKDFNALRANLLEYARLYYPDRLRDFSESSLGGLLLDMAAYVGDNMSFYLDHQFGELDPTTAVESVNIQRTLDAAGVPVVGASPALCPVTFYIEVPAAVVNNVIGPNPDTLPIVKANSTFAAQNGVIFNLLEDLDYTAKNSQGILTVVATGQAKIGQKTSTGVPVTYILALTGICLSGQETTENILIGPSFVPFNKLTLANADVSQIVSTNDLLGNIYYEVDTLSNDIVYQNVLNLASDVDLVPNTIKIIPAPYRFVTNVDLLSRKTTMTFGGGNADSLEDDVIPDPSSFAISFPYTTTFSRIAINPQQLLQTTTQGVAAANTTYQITYRWGGGLNHNVGINTIQTIKRLNMIFPGNPTPAVAATVRSSLTLTNKVAASGGEDAPTSDDLKSLIPSVRNSQERIVTREDLLARVYTIPSNFGRVFRAAVRSNPHNPLATQLHIVSRNPQGQLITSPDTLKNNLVKYLNPYRMISDAIDILDARVIDLQFSFDVLIDPTLNRAIVIQNILSKLQTVFDIKNFQIDQPIVLDPIRNTIFNVPGVLSINNYKFTNIQGTVNNLQYSNVTYDIEANTKMGIIFPPAGGIFEIRYPDVDIIGKAAV